MPKKLNTTDFIYKSNLIHENKYNYSLVNYINTLILVDIICPAHGSFKQKPKYHLLGKGCSKCSGKNKTTEQFIIEANFKHLNKYNYSLTNYNNTTYKVKIVCPEHGIFEQSPNSHLSGKGCPICKESKGERKVKEYLKNNKITFIQQYKFKDCKNKKQLPFDFYLPDYNMCIEYDGEQHFKPMRYINAIEKFNKTIVNDTIKNDFCEINNIKLIRIKYTDVDFETKLDSTFP